ncbi:MAG: hypothetical protein JWM28_159, partial [Chitinophagaceae bacterium]|nr:hypothetical protein [Chitinophagaceae bacterium]
NKLPFYIVFINLLAGLSVIIYWIQKQIRITQHSIEFREMIFLVIESLIVGISVYYILSSPLNHWIKVVQYIIFGLHWILTLLALAFMLTFRIKRLF